MRLACLFSSISYTFSSCSLEARFASSAFREDRVLPIVYRRMNVHGWVLKISAIHTKFLEMLAA